LPQHSQPRLFARQRRSRCAPVLAVGPKAAFPSGPLPVPEGPVSHFYRDAEQWPTADTVPLAAHDLAQEPQVDLVIAGAGPAGVAVASRVAAAGFSVCVVDPSPFAHWPNNYGVWLDEFQVRRPLSI
jgi:lycopene beta-cyclase